jgi:hypothetical protein
MSNTRTITNKTITAFIKSIATAHVDINGFHRFNMQEVNNALSDDIKLPALLLEAPSINLSSETKMVSNFNTRNISMLIMDHVQGTDNFEAEEDVLENCEGIALDINSYLVKCAKDTNHFLFGKFDINTVRIEKAGPIFDNMFGWNILFDIKAHEPMCFVSNKWDFSQ